MIQTAKKTGLNKHGALGLEKTDVLLVYLAQEFPVILIS